MLGKPDVTGFLRDSASAASVLADCYAVSRAFTPDLPMPAGGFASSSGFDPNGPLADELRRRHDQAMTDLYYGADRPPTFDAVLARVEASRSLLDIR